MALALGPFISGAIAHYASWRISFYIIIPCSALGIVVVFFSISHLHKSENAHLTNTDILKKIDWVGFGISAPMTVTLVLALQWGGTIYAWASWRIIFLLVLSGVLIAVFLFWERRAREGSMIPLNMLRQRSVALASIITFCDFAHLSVVAYYVCVPAELLSTKPVLETDFVIVAALLSGSAQRIHLRIWSHVSSLGCDTCGCSLCWRALDDVVRLL
jgi:MFS family permease